LVGCKWLFKVKLKSIGYINHYKTPVVTKGYSQMVGINYQESFSLVVKITSVKALMAIVVEIFLELHQKDVKIMFWNGYLNEDIYMQQPKGYVKLGTKQLVCKLRKTIYGFK